MACQDSKWGSVPEGPADPVLGLSAAFVRDTCPNKVNLGVGAYRDGEGKPFVLRVVRKMEKQMAEENLNHEYIPIEGLPEFTRESPKLLLGNDHPAVLEGRVATCQSVAGTGAVRLGAEFLAKYNKDSIVFVSNPTWGNHINIFKDSGFADVRQYRYFHKATKMLDFEGLCEDINSAPDGSIFVLHTCAHNPTGVDPTPEQWGQLADLFISKKHIPFFDTAYQGFASGDLHRDGFSVRLFASKGIELFGAQSYSKNFGLYGERVGAINVVCKSAEVAKHVLSQLKIIVRPMYSSPQVFPARIVARVLSNKELFAEWEEDMKVMADRIFLMRQMLYDALIERKVPGDWTPILKQIGMFTFTGMTPAQVELLLTKYHIYLTKDGRVSMAGLSTSNVPYLADAMLDAITHVQ